MGARPPVKASINRDEITIRTVFPCGLRARVSRAAKPSEHAATGLVCGSVDPAFFFDSPFIQGLIDLFGGDSSNLPISCFCGKMEPGEVISGSTDFLACLEKSTLPPPPPP